MANQAKNAELQKNGKEEALAKRFRHITNKIGSAVKAEKQKEMRRGDEKKNDTTKQKPARGFDKFKKKEKSTAELGAIRAIENMKHFFQKAKEETRAKLDEMKESMKEFQGKLSLRKAAENLQKLVRARARNNLRVIFITHACTCIYFWS